MEDEERGDDDLVEMVESREAGSEFGGFAGYAKCGENEVEQGQCAGVCLSLLAS